MTIFITGASGLVGRYLITELLSNTDCNVVAVSSTPEVVNQRHASPRLISIGYNVFLSASNDSENRASFLGGGVIC